MMRPFTILMVDDDPDDVRLTVEVLRESKLRNELHAVPNGEAAMRFLRREAPYTDAPRPDIVLLDLNLPGLSGHEVLDLIKAEPGLAPIPVVIVTTSSSNQDVLDSYRKHANCYVTKPVDLQQFSRVVRSVEEFWFDIARLPSEAS